MKFWLTLFFQIAIVSIARGQQQKETMLSGTIFLNNKEIEGIFIKNENSNETTNSDANGRFAIKCQLGDILNFSSINAETKRKKITKSEYQTNSLMVIMTSKTIDLNEVIINNNTITAEKLGVIPENQKKYTPAERRLKTAGDFKPIHLLSILGGTLPLDPIINKISGRTKRLKKELEIEKKEHLFNRLKTLYKDDFYVMNLKIPKMYIDSFRYFCIENQFLVTYLTSGNKQLLELLMSELAVTFNKKLSSEE
ncbi:carboxypeptidase-like regulatory domain-containing protein [Flavobacterium polysaccharolyticum]|uniref:Carboxypeptidase-like regulatory domain-containing protein n=1 Tax=Flavobacterium polysaccharolyticum TaxID=3133148 RepID=A0ABU9NN89_9FLAO